MIYQKPRCHEQKSTCVWIEYDQKSASFKQETSSLAWSMLACQVAQLQHTSRFLFLFRFFFYCDIKFWIFTFVFIQDSIDLAASFLLEVFKSSTLRGRCERSFGWNRRTWFLLHIWSSTTSLWLLTSALSFSAFTTLSSLPANKCCDIWFDVTTSDANTEPSWVNITYETWFSFICCSKLCSTRWNIKEQFKITVKVCATSTGAFWVLLFFYLRNV